MPAEKRASKKSESESVEGVKTYTMDEIKKHNNRNDAWLLIHNHVFDVTKFLNEHPGGPEIVAAQAGRDATDEYEAVGHSSKSNQIALGYHIGQLAGVEVKPWSTGASGSSSGSSGPNLGMMLPMLLILAALIYKFVL